jgi:malonate transporter
MLYEIATALSPVFLALALGYFAGRKGIVDNKNVADINSFVMMFAVPAALFASIAATNRGNITSHGTFIAVAVIAMLVFYAVVLWLGVKVFKHDKGDAAVQALSVSFPNTASIGLPLAAAVIGGVGTIAVAFVLALGAMTISPLTMAILENEKTGSGAPGSTVSVFLSALGKSVRKPIFLAPLAAFVLVLSGVHLPRLVDTTLAPIGNAAAGAALFLTGLIVSAHKVTFDKEVASGIVLKNALMPLFTWGLCSLFGLDRLNTVEAVLVTAIPCGFFGLVFGTSFGVRPKVSGSTVLLSTVAGIVSLSVVIGLLPDIS